MHEQSWRHTDTERREVHLLVESGPWDDEPDKVQWVDEATDLDCLAVRNSMGVWCGYVGVPPCHPAHGADYTDLDVDVHGGLTFASSCNEEAEDEGHGICHVPLPGREANVWWLGFDCGHVGFDVIPAFLKHDVNLPKSGRFASVYRNLDYVKAECASLAAQLLGEVSA